MPEKERKEWEVGDPTISVVGEQFCKPYPMDLMVRRKINNFSKDYYDVFDLTGNLILHIEGRCWGFSRKKIMRDPAGFVILTMRRRKGVGMKSRWEVYGGESKEREDLLFVANQTHALSIKTCLDVFLPENINKDVNDFRASGGYSNISFRVCKSDVLIAGVAHKVSWGSFCRGKYSFRVRVNPEVDYAFIASLLAIIDDNETLW